MLSVILLASGIGIIMVMMLTEKQLTEKLEKNIGKIDLVVGASGSPLQIIMNSVYHIDAPTGNIKLKDTYFLSGHKSEEREIKKHPFIDYTIPMALGDSYQPDGAQVGDAPYRIVGAPWSYVDLYEGTLKEGEQYDGPMDCVIGSELAIKYGMKIGDRFAGNHGTDALAHSHGEFVYTVTGVLEKSRTVLDQLILTPISSVWVVHPANPEGGSFDVKTVEEFKADSIAALQADSVHPDSVLVAILPEVEEHDHEHHDHDHAHHDHDHGHHHQAELDYDSILATFNLEDMEITTLLVIYKDKMKRAALTIPNMVRKQKQKGLTPAEPSIEQGKLLTLIDGAVKVVTMMAYFIMIISAISVFIALYSSLKSRKYEIALTRVMGASRAKVLAMIISEGLMLSVLGFMAAIVISRVGMMIFAANLEEAYHYEFNVWSFHPDEINLLGVALIIGLVSAIIPAIKAYKTDISTTLSK